MSGTIATLRPVALVASTGQFSHGSGLFMSDGSPSSGIEPVILSTGMPWSQAAFSAMYSTAFPSYGVTNKALTSNVATLTTSQPHDLNPGELVTVAGVDSTFNGTWRVLATGNNTFTYSVTAANVASVAATGTVTFADFGRLPLAQIRYVQARYWPGTIPFNYSTPSTMQLFENVGALVQPVGPVSSLPLLTPLSTGGGAIIGSSPVNASLPGMALAAAVIVNYAGQPLSAGDVDGGALLVNLALPYVPNLPAGAVQCQISELYLDVFFNEAPTATITAPTSGATLTGPSNPTLTWTYADPEGDIQERFRALAFSAAQITAQSVAVSHVALTSNVATITTSTAHGLAVGNTVTLSSISVSGSTFNGTWVVTSVPSTTTFTLAIVAGNVASAAATGNVFSPDTATTTFADSGETYSSGTSWAPSIGLVPNGSFTYYVKVCDQGSGGRYGAWSTVTFTTNVTVPTAPSIAVSVNSATMQVSVTVTQPAVGGSFSGAVNNIQQSDDGGATWTTMYGSPIASPSTSGVTVIDYAALVGTPRMYRANVQALNGSSQTVIGPWVVSASASFSGTLLWSLRDPYFPADSMFGVAVNRGPETKTILQDVYDTLGAKYPTFEIDHAAGWDGAVMVTSLSQAQFNALMKLSDTVAYPLLFSSASGENRWIQLMNPVKRTPVQKYVWQFTLTFRQAANPLNGNPL